MIDNGRHHLLGKLSMEETLMLPMLGWRDLDAILCLGGETLMLPMLGVPQDGGPNGGSPGGCPRGAQKRGEKKVSKNCPDWENY